MMAEIDRQQPGVCPECKGRVWGSADMGGDYGRLCFCTGQQPATDERGRPLTYWGGLAQPKSGETWANLRAECSYHTNGACSTRACMAKLPDGRLEMPPRFIGCDHYRALKELDRLQSALTAAQQCIDELTQDALRWRWARNDRALWSGTYDYGIDLGEGADAVADAELEAIAAQALNNEKETK